ELYVRLALANCQTHLVKLDEAQVAAAFARAGEELEGPYLEALTWKALADRTACAADADPECAKTRKRLREATLKSIRATVASRFPNWILPLDPDLGPIFESPDGQDLIP
ncbi:MAG: hypothetical protein AAFX85_05875, partial [Pseudomonadota bacterium]